VAPSQPAVIAEALWYVGLGQAEIRQEKLAPLRADEVRVRALHGGLSRGTEALVLTGRVPTSEFERMRAPFMAGDFPFPVKYGYATVGRIEDSSEGSRGRTVFTLHPHQTIFNIPASAAVVLPENVPPRRAVLAANMETALNAVWDASPKRGDRIAVADVTLVDVNPKRANLAEVLGVGFSSPGTAKGDCDLVFHASGNSSGLGTALGLAGEEATLIELSWYGNAPVSAPLGGAFHSRRLRLVSSQVGRVAPSHRPRWTHGRRLAAALALLADVRLDALLAPAIAFQDLPRRLPEILDTRNDVLCQLITYT